MKKSLFMISLFTLFIFLSCKEENQLIENDKNTISENQVKRPQERQVIYAHFVMKDVLEYRTIINYYTLALIQNGIEIEGFDTNQDPEFLQHKIDRDIVIYHFINHIDLPFGPGGPIKPLPPPRPCFDEIYNLVKGSPQNFMQFTPEELKEISQLIFRACQPKIDLTSNLIKIIFNNSFDVKNLIIKQDDNLVAEITNHYQDNYGQTIVELETNFDGSANLIFSLDLPVANHVEFSSTLYVE